MGVKLSRKYRPLWESKANYFVITGGRGSGKSFGVGDFIENLTFQEGHAILFTRYTLRSAADSIIPEFEEKIKVEGHEDVFDVTKDVVTNTKTGSRVMFKGIRTSSGNQTAALKSLQGITTWVLEEAEELHDEATFDKIDESVRQKGIQNRVILILNPVTKEHWIYRRFFEQMGVKEGFNGEVDNVCYIHTDYRDNKLNLSDKFLNKAKLLKEKNREKYEHRFLGGWLDKAEGVIYDNWSYGKFDESLPYGYGLDFGFSNDPDALVKVAIDKKQKKIYLKQLIYQNGQTTTDLIRKLETVGVKKGELIVADSAGDRVIADIRRKGFNIVKCDKGKGSIVNGIRTLQDFELIVDHESTKLGVELNNYCWTNKAGSVPMDDYNHLLDAGRYYVAKQIKKNSAGGARTHGNRHARSL